MIPKKHLAGIATAAMLVAAATPGMAADTVGFAVPNLASSFWISATYGVQKAADELGVELVVVDAGGDGNAVQQISQIQDLVQRGVDAMVIGATNGDSIAPVVEQALAADIKVVGLSSPPSNAGLSAIVSADHYDMGKLQAECLGEALGGAGNVAMMAGPSGQVWSDRRADGFRETLADKFPDIEVIAESRLADNRNDALRVAEDWAQRFPEINGIYSATDDMAAGVIAAYDAAGNTSVKFSASNLSPTAQDLIKSGKLACTSIQKIVLQGYEALKAAVAAADGQSVEASIVTPALLVDAANLESVDLSDVVAPADYRP
jgi:ABC-type sugar transport system substrate-binding protein